MDMGRVFSDAWRTTFRTRTQWSFIGVMAAVSAALGVVYFAAYGAVLKRVFGTSGMIMFDPTYETPTIDLAVEDYAGVLMGMSAIVFVVGVASFYVRALMESGLVYSAGAIARGQSPDFSETMREGFAASLRAWGAQILAALALFGVGLLLAIALGVLGVFGALSASSGQGDSPAFLPVLCIAMPIIVLVWIAAVALYEAWSQLSVRHIVLWRQGVFAGMKQGAQVLRARLGSALLVLMAYMGTAIALAIVFSIVFFPVAALLPEDMPVFALLALEIPYFLVGIAVTVYFSNVWTAFVLQARPDARYASLMTPPPGAYPPEAYPTPYPPPGFYPPPPAPPETGVYTPPPPPEAPLAPEAPVPPAPEAPLAPEPPAPPEGYPVAEQPQPPQAPDDASD